MGTTEMSEHDDILKAAKAILATQTPLLDAAELEAFVRSFLNRRNVFLALRDRHGSPLYVLEKSVLRERARRFVRAFEDELPDVRVYYAVKSNSLPPLLSVMVAEGLGLDASSGVEIELALDCGAEDIVFSGPGKTDDELRLAVDYAARVTVLMDSFDEMERLAAITSESGSDLRAGVRLATDEQGLWRKFGIPLSDLPRFFDAAVGHRHIRLCGLQFHTSWNLDPRAQTAFIERLGGALAEMDAAACSRVEFVDIGGGFWPQQGEWLQPAGTPEGRLREAALPGKAPPLAHYRLPSTPIEGFAREIGEAVREHLLPHVTCCICAEPGRWLCHDAMHLLMTVVDRKADDLVIADAGTNTVGWDRFEVDYFPVINLSRPALEERACHVLGSLCTPHDVWGFSYHGEDIRPGDALLIPTQGAYTYSLRQQFIKPLPKVATLGGKRPSRNR